jgi:acetolactate synthase I/II/III large subunit
VSAESQMTVAELLIGRLKQRGLQRFFGVPGGGSSMDLIDAGRRAGLDFVLSRREDAGAIMAAVTAWLSGAPGLALATKGPGLTSAANGIASAYLDRAEVLFVSDGFGADEQDYVSHQYFDQAALLAPITKANATLAGDDPGAEIDELLQTLSRPPKGPAYIELTGSVAKRSIAAPTAMADAAPRQLIGDVDEARALIKAAKRPVIVAGFESAAGAAHRAVRHLAEALNAPALVTYMAKGVIPDDHACFAGIFTGGQAEFPCVSEADLIILVGLDPVELIRKPWTYTAPVLDLGEVRHGKHYLVPDVGLYGPIAETIGRLSDDLPVSEWTGAEIAYHRAHFTDAMAFRERPDLTPVEIVKSAAAAFAGRPRLAVDAGAHMFSAVAFWPAQEPYDVLISNGLATMAFALPAAIAAALHDPDRGALAMTGDGGLMMCMGELVTAAQQKANLTVIVFNDGALSLIDIKRQEMQLPDLGFTWQRPDFAATAEGLGLTAWRVTTANDLKTALEAAASNPGPCLIDVVVEPDGYLEQMRSLRG